MKRTAGKPADPTPKSVHVNGSSTKRQPRRKWKPELERDRSMRAYEQNPRAIAGQLELYENSVRDA